MWNLVDGLASYEHALTNFLTVLPSTDPSLAACFDKIGSVFALQCLSGKAVENYERALKLRIDAQEPDFLTTATYHSKIGLNLMF